MVLGGGSLVNSEVCRWGGVTSLAAYEWGWSGKIYCGWVGEGWLSGEGWSALLWLGGGEVVSGWVG